jgi:hypothetical protein
MGHRPFSRADARRIKNSRRSLTAEQRLSALENIVLLLLEKHNNLALELIELYQIASLRSQ